MARIDYGQVPPIDPYELKCFQSGEMIKTYRVGSTRQTHEFEDLKWIDGRFLNSHYRSDVAIAFVGKNKTTGRWNIIRVCRVV